MTTTPSTTPRAAVLTGLGTHVPSRVVTNHELAQRIDTSDEWIRQRTGIRERRTVEPGQVTSDLAVPAATAALRSAGTDQVDAVVLATTTPDRLVPATAPTVAHRLGVGHAMAFDVNSACSGFIHALACGAGLIAAGTADSVLVIGADTITTRIDPTDRATVTLFGDGAGAVVLQAGGPDQPGALGPFNLGSDGAFSSLIHVPGNHTASRRCGADDEEQFVVMDGKNAYRHAVARLTQSSATALAAAGWTAKQLRCLVAHQANQRIIEAVAQRLDLPLEHCAINIGRLGNTVAASVPLALEHAARAGLISANDKILLTAFGAGLSWGSTTLTWPDISIP
ncbi:beta-ketoacyl-ACP synthase III [Streptomyces sp. NPDC004435]|uniref:beta-ketoacyl-ACP synthase III n=1 Tax=Streptomyces sp. NPDC004435 TaxID=3364701 RepID=UPI0036850238